MVQDSKALQAFRSRRRDAALKFGQISSIPGGSTGGVNGIP